MVLPFLIMAVFTTAMLAVAYCDAMTMTIPNKLSVLILGAFFLVVPLVWPVWTQIGNPWMIFGEHLAVGISMFLMTFAMFAVGGLGGGDSKILAATAFWWQWPDLFPYVLYTTVAGGVVAMFILTANSLFPTLVLSNELMYRVAKNKKDIPYGLALAFGALATLPASEIFKAAARLG